MAHFKNTKCPKCGQEAFSGCVSICWKSGGMSAVGACSGCEYTGSLEYKPTAIQISKPKTNFLGCVLILLTLAVFFFVGLGVLWHLSDA